MLVVQAPLESKDSAAIQVRQVNGSLASRGLDVDVQGLHVYSRYKLL